MGAPNIMYQISNNKVSAATGFDSITVVFSADVAYTAFECRATKAGEAWGIGVGALIASFSTTPADVTRTFDIYDDYLVHGDGDYRISLYVQSEDGAWNDTIGFVPSGATSAMQTADGLSFLTRKGNTNG